MRPDDLRSLPIFDGLTDEQLAELVDGGVEVRIEPGVELFREGEHADAWWVLVSGAIDLVRRIGREDTVVARMDVPGRWAGGFRAWDEHGVYLATGRGAAPGRVLRVPAEVLRDRSNAWFPFGGHLIQGLYHTARSIESTVRQRESLVTLGTLAAGLAHEINNPATAATRAVDALEDASAALLGSLGRLARDEVSPGQEPAALRFSHRNRPVAEQPEDHLLDGFAGLGEGELSEPLRKPCPEALRRLLRDGQRSCGDGESPQAFSGRRMRCHGCMSSRGVSCSLRHFSRSDRTSTTRWQLPTSLCLRFGQCAF